MKSNEIPTSDFQLKVFLDPSQVPDDRSEIDRQLPFINELTERFEQVTGWNLEYLESRQSLNQRTIVGDDSLVGGALSITDLSEKLEAGRSARHRGYCERLVETLDSMIKLLQSDRAKFARIQKSLAPVVEMPFEWWAVAGKTGYRSGDFCSWSITSDEKVRLFGGRVESAEKFDDAIAATTVISTFETSCQASIPVHEIAPLLPAVLSHSRYLNSKLNWFSTIELDPISGEFLIDGYNSNNGLALIDVDSSTAIRFDEAEQSGTLYSGQVLCVGISDVQLNRLNEKLIGTELTIEHCRKIVESEFAELPTIFVYRK